MEPNAAVPVGVSAIEWARFILDVVRLLFSWPVIAGALLGWFLWHFKAEVRNLLASVSRVRGWGVEIERQPIPESGGPEPPIVDGGGMAGKTFEEAQREVSELMASVRDRLGEDKLPDISRVLGLFRENVYKATDASRQWWLRYLRAFLKDKTTRALAWIAEHPAGVSRAEFNTVWDAGIEVDSARDVLETLLREQLVSEDSEHMLNATAAGIAFRDYVREQSEEKWEQMMEVGRRRHRSLGSDE